MQGVDFGHWSAIIQLMSKNVSILNRWFAALLAGTLAVGAVAAQPAEQDGPVAVETLLQELARPDQERWQRLERQIVRRWSQSGSPSADLLLQRGRAALRSGDSTAAIEHLTALVDHAPEFAEGWNARATAYFQAGQYGPSMADIRQALRLNPAHFGALAGLGIILEDLGYEERALAAFEAARDIHPHRPDLQVAVGRLELRVKGNSL